MFEIVGREEQVFEQWEQGVTLSNPCMKAGHEVVFRNSSGATYVMIAREESGAVVCDVPNKLLQMCCNILVDLEQGNDRHTECRTTFTVNPAQKPDGYKCVDNTVPDNRISFNDLKDKPFYEEKAVLVERKVEFFEYGNDPYSYGEVTGVSLGLVEGNKYRVNFDGVEFESAATFLDNGDVQLLMLTSSEPGEADEYYTVFEVIGKEMMSYECAPPRATATIKIESTKVKTIDPKFIPAGVGGGKVIYYWDPDAGTVTDANGHDITVGQAKKDAFNVVIYNYLNERYIIPCEVILKETYVEINFWEGNGVNGINFGEMPK